MKIITYKKYVKDNDIPKEKRSKIIPGKAVLTNPQELPIGLETSIAKTDGLGYELVSLFIDKSKKIEIRKVRKEHGQYFSWE